MFEKVKYWAIRVGFAVIALDLAIAAAVLFAGWYYTR